MSEALENLEVGTLVIFGGYTELPEGEDAIFEEGMTLEITEVTEDGGYMVKDEDGNTDTVFPEELSGLADADGDEPLDWKDVKKGEVVEVVDADGETVASGEVTAKTSTNVTIDGNKYTKKDHDFYLPAEDAAEEEAEAEDGAEDEELKLADIEKGMEIDVVDENDEVVATGKVSSTTKTAVKIGRKSYTADKYGFFLAEEQAEEEQAEEKKAPAKSEKKAPAKAKGKGKEKAKETKKEQELQVTDTESLAAILEDQDALEAAKDIIETIEESYFNLGGLLAHIYTEELYLQAGYEGKKAFDQYVSEELGIEYRKAMYLIKIYTHFSNLGVDETRLAEIGWSKAKELVGIATEENFDELVDYANEHSRDELKEYIKTTYVDAGDGSEVGSSNSNKAKRTTFKFSAHEDQANVILEAIEKVKDEHGITDDSEAMIAIFTEWSQLVDGIDIPLSVAVENMEARYGVSVTTGEAKVPAKQEKKAPAKAADKKAPAKKPASRSRKAK